MNIPGEVYLVGGAVRDALLGRSSSDRDWVVVGATPDAMLEAGFTQVGRDFPVFLHPTTHEEYALARTERKTASGHLGFVCHAGPEVTLEEDLLRRDLTVNAIAQSLTGEFIDPYGGVRDLERRQLRHVSAAFAEDPLRILRVARFAAQLGFSTTEETLHLMRGMTAANALAELPAERVWQEFVKALSTDKVSKFVATLHTANGLHPWFVELAELDKQFQFVGASALQRYGCLAQTLGEKAMASLSTRLRTPGRFAGMANAVARYGDTLSTWPQADPGALLSALRIVGVLQKGASTRQEDFSELVGLLELLFPAAANLNSLPKLIPLASQLAGIGASQVADRELKGPEIGAAIAQLREAVVRSAQAEA